MDEAEQLFREGLEQCQAKMGPEHPQSLSSMGNLAGLLKEKGDLEEAETLFRQSLEHRRKQLGETHPDTLASMHNLAGV